MSGMAQLPSCVLKIENMSELKTFFLYMTPRSGRTVLSTIAAMHVVLVECVESSPCSRQHVRECCL